MKRAPTEAIGSREADVCKSKSLQGALKLLPENCNALAVHQVQCGEGYFPLESSQVKSLSEPMVRPEKSHVGFWSGRES